MFLDPQNSLFLTEFGSLDMGRRLGIRKAAGDWAVGVVDGGIYWRSRGDGGGGWMDGWIGGGKERWKTGRRSAGQERKSRDGGWG